jgi:transcription elongation regulator 1
LHEFIMYSLFLNAKQISSWQLPPEVAELNKNADSGSLKGSSTSLQDAGTVGHKGETSGEISTPAILTGGRDSLPLRQTVAPASTSALDLIKKKLQDAGAFSVSSPLATPSSTASELNGSKPADGAPKGQQGSNNGEKSKDNNGNENLSDSSSDSDDEERGPSKDDCIREFKVIPVTLFQISGYILRELFASPGDMLFREMLVQDNEL